MWKRLTPLPRKLSTASDFLYNPRKYFSAEMTSEFSHPRWNNMWNAGIAPGEKFDCNCPAPVLLKYLDLGKVPNGRALVPGCGRGYDIYALANSERYVLGIDIAENAVKAALEVASTLSVIPPRSYYDIETTSFFDLPTDSASKFDFVYDYTFLCALDPQIRPDWARKMADLVKEGGVLMTVIFPIRDDENIPGPPFTVSLDLYKRLLEPVGFQCLELDYLPSELCHPDRDGSSVTGKPQGSSGIGLWKKI